VNEAEAELRSIGLDLEEIRATGREPMHSLTAPLVSGRDFVAERWRVEMTAPIAALALEKTRAAAARGRVEIGIGNRAKWTPPQRGSPSSRRPSRPSSESWLSVRHT
jgi:hypothetical protein